jgi:hypothetical protein
LKQKNTVILPCGTFIPQYMEDGKRKKLTKSLTIHENGNIASMILQDPSQVYTKMGNFPAEMVTFYENGAIRRIFPVFGSITGFWTEEDEYRISPELKFDLPFSTFSRKVINITFYETGDLKSITLWPKDSLSIKTPAGEIQTRIGFCLYPGGTIKSVEPRGAVSVNTPIGSVPAFDPDALGIDGESNSLVFSQDGNVKSLLTTAAQVRVSCKGRGEIVHAPSFKNSNFFDNKLAVIPMKIAFSDGYVQFGRRKSKKTDAKYKISECSFKIENISTEDYCNTCDECF